MRRLQPTLLSPRREAVPSKGSGPPSSSTIQSALWPWRMWNTQTHVLSFVTDNPKSIQMPKLEVTMVTQGLRRLKDDIHRNHQPTFLIFPFPPLPAAVFHYKQQYFIISIWGNFTKNNRSTDVSPSVTLHCPYLKKSKFLTMVL